jgi:hypothetical protein
MCVFRHADVIGARIAGNVSDSVMRRREGEGKSRKRREKA